MARLRAGNLAREHFEDGADLYERVSAMGLEGRRAQRERTRLTGRGVGSLDQGEMLEPRTRAAPRATAVARRIESPNALCAIVCAHSSSCRNGGPPLIRAREPGAHTADDDTSPVPN